MANKSGINERRNWVGGKSQSSRQCNGQNLYSKLISPKPISAKPPKASSNRQHIQKQTSITATTVPQPTNKNGKRTNKIRNGWWTWVASIPPFTGNWALEFLGRCLQRSTGVLSMRCSGNGSEPNRTIRVYDELRGVRRWARVWRVNAEKMVGDVTRHLWIPGERP